MIEYHLISVKTCPDCLSSARKSYKIYSSNTYPYATRIWKEDILDIEKLMEMDASEIHEKKDSWQRKY